MDDQECYIEYLVLDCNAKCEANLPVRSDSEYYILHFSVVKVEGEININK